MPGIFQATKYDQKYYDQKYSLTYDVNLWPSLMFQLKGLSDLFEKMHLIIYSSQLRRHINSICCILLWARESWKRRWRNTKIRISLEQKELFTWNEKPFSSFLKGFLLHYEHSIGKKDSYHNFCECVQVGTDVYIHIP